MRNEPEPGILTWGVIIVVTCLILYLFERVLWLVVPGLLALVGYYCLQPLVQALVRAGLKHRTAGKVVTGLLFLVTVPGSDFAFVPGDDAGGGLEGGDGPLCARGAGFSGKDRGTVGGETAADEKVGPDAEHPDESGRGGGTVCGEIPGPAAVADGLLAALAPAGALSDLLHVAGWESVQETPDPQRAQRVFREDTAVV